MIKPLFQRVLVAYDGSKESLQAALYGIIMAKTLKCQLKVVYVVDTATIKHLALSKFLVAEEAASAETALTQDGERNLAYVEQLAKTKGVRIQTQLLRGAVWSQIIAASQDFNANVILVGGNTTIRSATDHNVVGSNNRELINSAKCSVMVVREPYVEQLFKLA